jgi:hypothetical protein
MKKNPIEMIKAANAEGEPTFTIRAKDKISLEVLKRYYHSCCLADCSDEYCNAILDILSEFEEWRDTNHEKIKLPD